MVGPKLHAQVSDKDNSWRHRHLIAGWLDALPEKPDVMHNRSRQRIPDHVHARASFTNDAALKPCIPGHVGYELWVQLEPLCQVRQLLR
jgi:hypothetical protein